MGNKARIKCVTYGGRLGWFLRCHFSRYTSWAYLALQYRLRKGLFERYIRYFNAQAAQGNYTMPCLISIETIDRCNGTCEFCPANKNADKRPFAKMDEVLFHKLIGELAECGYDGYLNLYVNNEPFMDTRIEDWYRYAKEYLPKAKMLLYTNGTLITEQRFRAVIPYIDKMIINNYSDDLTLHPAIKAIYELVQKTPEYWDKDITIQLRYVREILTNRAGAAPNKQQKKNSGMVCIMPFTDITVYPNGTVGLCCSDAQEKTNLGNVATGTLREVWRSTQYRELRRLLGEDRDGYPFCAGCDFVDAGIRNDFMRGKLAREKM